MDVFLNLDKVPKFKIPVVTLGTFDGIHLGHQKLIEHLLEKKECFGGTAILATFEPHPQLILNNRQNPIALLTTLEEKIFILQNFPIDAMIVIPFSKNLAELSGESFIKKILIEKIGLKDIVIGYDHAFGKNRSGNAETLRKMGAEYGFSVNVVEPVSLDGQIVKSTAIRQALENGEVEQANRFLGRPYSFSGTVVKGVGRGKNHLFPTANIHLNHPKKLIPADGVYVVQVEWFGRRLPGIANIGMRPTFSEQERAIEVHLLDFNENIYGQFLEIKILKRLRKEKKFDSIEALRTQIQMDIAEARKYFNQVN